MTNMQAGYLANSGSDHHIVSEAGLAEWYDTFDEVGQLRMVTADQFSGAVDKLDKMKEIESWPVTEGCEMVVWSDGVSVVVGTVGCNNLVRWMSRREWDDWNNRCPFWTELKLEDI